MRDSPTYGESASYMWSDKDAVAVLVPEGVAHVVYFLEDSVLAFGMSDYWREELDVIGCQWDDPKLGFNWDIDVPLRSQRDEHSSTYNEMVDDYHYKKKTILTKV